jgi:hypothetical protein
MKQKTRIILDLLFGIIGLGAIICILFIKISQENLLNKISEKWKYFLDLFSTNIFPIIFSFIIGVIIVIIINTIIKNKKDTYYNRLKLFLIGLPLIILINIFILDAIIKLYQNADLTWWSLLFMIIFPIGFFIIFLGITTEYYKFCNETLIIKKGIFNKLEKINVKDIISINFRTDFNGEGVTYYYLLGMSDNRIFELNQTIDDIYGLIQRILSINNNIYITIKTELEKPKQTLFSKIIGMTMVLLFYTIDVYLIINIISKWYFA